METTTTATQAVTPGVAPPVRSKRTFLNAFVPYGRATKASVFTVTAAWVAAVATWWLYYTPPVVPMPMDLVHATMRLWTQRAMLEEIIASLALNFGSIGTAAAISLALAYGSTLPAIRPLAETVAKLRFLGLGGLSFLLYVLLQAEGRSLQVTMLTFGISVFLTTSLLSVVHSVPKDKLDHARTLRMGPWHVLWEVHVLGTLDQVLDNLRQNAAIGWVMLTMVEGNVRSQGGIGLLMADENRQFHYDAVFAIQAHILGIGLLIDYGFGVLRSTLCPYADLKKERG